MVADSRGKAQFVISLECRMALVHVASSSHQEHGIDAGMKAQDPCQGKSFVSDGRNDLHLLLQTLRPSSWQRTRHGLQESWRTGTQILACRTFHFAQPSMATLLYQSGANLITRYVLHRPHVQKLWLLAVLARHLGYRGSIQGLLPYCTQRLHLLLPARVAKQAHRLHHHS